MTAVIFDLDGTLVDSAPDLQAAANRMLREAGLPALDLETVTSFIGNGIAKLVERCFARHSERPDDLPAQVARFQQLYEAEGHARTSLMPGVEAALRELADRGALLGLCTNKDTAPASAILRKLGVAPLFHAVIGGDSGLPKKPDPAPLLHCAAKCGAAAENAVFVGDSGIDAETAAAAGLPFLLYTEGYGGAGLSSLAPDAVFSDFAALPGRVAALSADASRAGLHDRRAGPCLRPDQVS